MAKFMFIDDNGSGTEVLGTADGRNEREAFKNLVRKSPWLRDHDYDDISAVKLAEDSYDSSEVDSGDGDDEGEGQKPGPRLATYAVLLVALIFVMWLFMSRLVSPAFTSGNTATQPVVKTVLLFPAKNVRVLAAEAVRFQLM